VQELNDLKRGSVSNGVLPCDFTVGYKLIVKKYMRPI